MPSLPLLGTTVHLKCFGIRAMPALGAVRQSLNQREGKPEIWRFSLTPHSNPANRHTSLRPANLPGPHRPMGPGISLRSSIWAVLGATTALAGLSAGLAKATVAAWKRRWRGWLRICGAGEGISGSAKRHKCMGLTRSTRLRLRAAMWRQWKHRAVAGRRCWNCVRGWQATPTAAILATGTSRRPKSFRGAF